MENTQKVPIVVPKVAFLGTFGTTIELFAILKVDDAYCCIQQIMDNKYLPLFKYKSTFLINKKEQVQ